MKQPDQKIFTVTAVTRLIKHTLEESFDSLWIEGEVSNYIHHSSGHRYLTLKDENAAIKVTLWRSMGQYLKFDPENGMKIRAYGDISVYEKSGQYQLNARKLLPAGVGELEVAFRQLHEKLSNEGLFDPALKKAIPEYPLTIGIVTSPTGAAIRDIIQIAQRRNDSVNLIIFPSKVQGKGAAESIKAGIEYFNSRDDIDIIITGRGGGSLEDLWAFNEEITVRAIAASQKPIVSAVGHEIDTTLSDLAADLRAPTPSAAAELVVWDKNEFLQSLESFVSRAVFELDRIVQSGRQRMEDLISRPVLQNPESGIHERMQYLDSLEKLLESSGKNRLEKAKNSISLLLSRLESLSPIATLKRGYSVLRKGRKGDVVRSVNDIVCDEELEAVLTDGFMAVMVKDIKRN